MKEKLKIVLGKKDLFPYKNEDVFVNLELSRDSGELVNEIINNNFNLREQFTKEREKSLKFCVYGTCETNFSDTENVQIEISTNHLDQLYSPKFSTNINPKTFHKTTTIPLSKSGSLSKNIFSQKKSSYYFIFEISPIRYNNIGKTKELILTIKSNEKKVYAEVKVPFIYYNSQGIKIPFGTETLEIDLKGKETIVENDFKFLYDTHWIRADLNLYRPPKVSFLNSLDNEFINNTTSLIQNSEIEKTSKQIIDSLNSSINSSFSSTDINNATIDESYGKFEFFAKLDYPSLYGIEEVDVYVKDDETIRNPNDDFILKTKTLKWEIGEQYKKVEVELLDDIYVENTEKVTFGLNNYKYSEKSNKNSEFFLTIEDKDKPIPISFALSSQQIVESATTLSVELFLDRPMNVPNQTIVVYVDLVASTAVIGKNFVGTDSTTVTKSSEKIEHIYKVDVEEKIPGSRLGGIIIRKDGGNFLDDGLILQQELTYSSTKQNRKIDTDKKIIIQSIGTERLALKESRLSYDKFFGPNNKNLQAKLVYEIETETVGAFEKTILLTEGVSDFKFDIEILNDFQYANDLNINFKLKNPTQNVIISNNNEVNEHNIIIKDSMIPNFTRYIMPGSFEKGYGMFRMNDFLLTEKKELKLRITNNPNVESILTDKFEYEIGIVNKGEKILIEDVNKEDSPSRLSFLFEKGYKPIESDGVVARLKIEAPSGFKEITIDLPSNYGLKKQLNQFFKSKYEFRLKAIDISAPPSQFFGGGFGSSGNNSLGEEVKARTFPEVIIKESSKGEIATQNPENSKYFLTSRIENIQSRILLSPQLTVNNLTILKYNSINDTGGGVIRRFPASGSFIDDGFAPGQELTYYSYRLGQPVDENIKITIEKLNETTLWLLNEPLSFNSQQPVNNVGLKGVFIFPNTCKDNITINGPKVVEMNGTIFLSEIFESSSGGGGNLFSGFFGGASNPYTKVLSREFTPYQINYLTCSGSSLNNSLIPVELYPNPGGILGGNPPLSGNTSFRGNSFFLGTT